MEIAIIGAGNVGAALGKGWARAGHRICYGVRDPSSDKHAAVASAAGGKAMTVAEAVKEGEVIVLAVPWSAIDETIAECGDLTGRTVIDVTNPLTVNERGIGLALGFDSSAGEQVQQRAKGASVFKTLNQVGAGVMADVSGYAAAPTMFVAGDDAAKKPVVMGLVRDLGFDAVDAGPMTASRLLEPYAMLWIHMVYAQGGPRDAAFALLKRER